MMSANKTTVTVSRGHTYGRREWQGFTLIELITVIAILGLLAALIMPMIGSAIESARKTKCQSNFRQIGSAIHLYLADQTHQVRLPGPSWNYVYPFDNVGLGIPLADYLGYQRHQHGQDTRLVDLFVCPSYDAQFNVHSMDWADRFGGNTGGSRVARPYRQNVTQRNEDGNRIFVFGDGTPVVGADGNIRIRNRGGQDERLPRLLSELNQIGLSKVWLMTDSDGNPNSALLGSSLSHVPIHDRGTTRNYLYGDGSVRSLNGLEHTFQAGW